MDIVISMDDYEYILSSTLLNKEDKRIFELLYDGLSNCEIARRLECSEGKVRYRRKRILSEINNYMSSNTKDKYTIYKHTFPNGKIYIGITKLEPSVRWNNGLGYVHNTDMFNDIILFGWNNIEHEILGTFNTTLYQIMSKERDLINEYKSNDKNYGYNK